ncbi:MAG: hypothetical protein COV09_01495 [Candidatus Vogelbacteria bacterium CG10_big_fil_rev_8_21_14_0_10_50_13]|uniref:Uncharacterized protein n=1 Tax=Candidatus Vogelbacteria bacterium CG10_big_fil_rev_8_21_14_0_10_50_13 TaxID=1975044 RepID=A0A2H0RFV4_9BACT|nr:MAG: hypothetical protein COV09_01495 [Candidatus Vogelbacteria bacterium CG10_big_fil_rev_8_21_14_0_10_50_13]
MEEDKKIEELDVTNESAKAPDDFAKAIMDAPPPVPPTLEEKREEAKRELAGPELAAKMEHEAKVRALKAERATINSKLEEIAKQKEKHELDWIRLDEKRKQIKDNLKPITDKEAELETKEDQLEENEDQMPLPAERQKIEGERWQVASERHQAEEEKWQVENKLMDTDKKIDVDTKEYRAILNEEDKLGERLDQIETELAGE